jgi:hypothetical protein
MKFENNKRKMNNFGPEPAQGISASAWRPPLVAGRNGRAGLCVGPNPWAEPAWLALAKRRTGARLKTVTALWVLVVALLSVAHRCQILDSVSPTVPASRREHAKQAITSGCGRTTSRMRGLSPKIISGDSRRSKNTQTQHIQSYNTMYEVQVRVITY